MEVRKYPFQAQNCPIKFASVGRASTIPLIKVDRWAKNLGWLRAPKFLTFRKKFNFCKRLIFIDFPNPHSARTFTNAPKLLRIWQCNRFATNKSCASFLARLYFNFCETNKGLKVFCSYSGGPFLHPFLQSPFLHGCCTPKKQKRDTHGFQKKK